MIFKGDDRIKIHSEVPACVRGQWSLKAVHTGIYAGTLN